MPEQREIFDKPHRHPRLPGNGYMGTPGTGPAGETCKSCDHLRCNERHYGSGLRRWYKCGLVKPGYTRVTDIRLDAPACHAWARPVAPPDQQP